MVALALVAGLGGASDARAAGSDFAEAMRVRRLIILPADRPVEDEAEVLMLPVSRGFAQRSTSLCWAYAALSGLETRSRVLKPESKLELSRRAMQFHTIRDRWMRRINGTASYTGERGVAVDAMTMIGGGGLVAFDDFTDVDDAYGSFDFAGAIGAAPDVATKVRALDQGLTKVYGVPPALTHLEEAAVSSADLAATVTAGQVWESYAVAKDGVEGYRKHPESRMEVREGSRHAAREFSKDPW